MLPPFAEPGQGFGRTCYDTARTTGVSHWAPHHVRRLDMARFCTLCGKDSIAGFNPQSVGMNRVRAHRRFRANLQPTVIAVGTTTKRVLVCTRCRRTASKGA